MEKWLAWSRAVAVWYKDWSSWLAAIFGLMVLGFFAARLSCGIRAFLSDPVTTQWAAAIATAVAAIIALGIASGEERRNRRREMRAGELAAGSMKSFVGCLRVMARQIEAQIPPASGPTDPATPRPALAAHLKDEVAFLRQTLEKIPAATIQPYNARITAHVVHMIDQLHVAEIAATFPGGDAAVRSTLLTVEQCCHIVEDLLAPAHQSAIQRHLSP